MLKRTKVSIILQVRLNISEKQYSSTLVKINFKKVMFFHTTCFFVHFNFCLKNLNRPPVDKVVEFNKLNIHNRQLSISSIVLF